MDGGVEQIYPNLKPGEIVHYDVPLADVKQEGRTTILWDFHSCDLCPYKSMSYYIIRSHMRRHRVTRTSKIFNCSTNVLARYKCNSCDYKTPLLVNFNKHIKVSHKKTVEVKIETNEKKESNTLVFSNFCNLKSNIESLKTFTCNNCNFKSYSQLTYISHYTKCPLNAVINGNSFFRRLKYDRQFLQWHKFHNKQRLEDYQLFQCPLCPYRAKRQTTLDGHVKAKHAIQKYNYKKKLLKRPRTVTLLLCDECSFFTPKLNILQNHIRSNHPTAAKDLFKCSRCPFKAKWQNQISRHIRRCHVPDSPKTHNEESHVEEHQVEESQTEENHRGSLVHHRYSGDPSRPLKCASCPYKAKWPSHIYRHSCWFQNQQSKDYVKFKCKYCTFRTNMAVSFLNHMNFRHPTLKCDDVYKCHDCHYMTLSKENLKKHKLKHRHVKQYQRSSHRWANCHRTERTSEELKVNTFKCELCTFETSQETEFRDHILKLHVTTETVTCFKCQLCAFKTIDELALKDHVLKSHVDPQNNEWYPCELCSIKYRKKVDLKNHILDKHIL